MLPTLAKSMETSKKSDKAVIRREIKTARRLLTDSKEQFWNEQLFSCISRMPEIINASFVYCYISCNHEADTRQLLDFLWASGIRTAAPKVLGAGRMVFYEISSMADLEPGTMGIPEPVPGCKPVGEQQAVVLTPGLAFDRRGYRVGYGGGYYDRFLAAEPQHVRVGIAYQFQLYDRVPSDHYDEQLDCLIVSGDRKGKRYEFDRNRKTGQSSIAASWYDGGNGKESGSA